MRRVQDLPKRGAGRRAPQLASHAIKLRPSPSIGQRSKRLDTTALEPTALKADSTGAMALTSRNYPVRLNIRL